MLKYTPVFETYEQSWLIKRLGNEPQRVIFSMIGSMNWICGLACLIKNLPVDKNEFYSEVLKLEIDKESTNKIFCNILMSLDYLNSLKKIGANGNVYALMRISTISWYYGIYNAAKSARITTHYSSTELLNLWEAINRICDGRTSPTLTLLRQIKTLGHEKVTEAILSVVPKVS